MPSPTGSSGLRTLLVLAWPVVLARSSQAVIGFCDALMIAPLGESALAATTTGAVNTYSLVILPMGIAYIVQSFAAQLSGKGDLAGARRYGWYGLILSGIMGLLAVATAPLIGPVLGLLPYEPDVHALMTDYMVIRLFSVAAILGVEVLGNWYGGLGNTRLHMIAGLFAMVLNVFLNWVLIHGNLGAPALGVNGAAIASVIATWASFGLLVILFVRSYGTERVKARTSLRRSEFLRMLRFGVPNGINWFLEFSAFIFFINVVVADLGTVVHAALMVVMQINSVSFMPAFGLASAGAILAGQAIGQGEHDEVPKIVRQTALAAATWQCGVGLIYLIIPTALVTFFQPPTDMGPSLLAIGATLLAISAAWQLFDAIAMTLGEILRSAGDTAWCMWARLTLAWLIFTPLALVVVRVLGGGVIGAVVAMIAYMAVLAAVLAWRFYISGAWRRIDLTGMEIPLH